MVSVLAKLLGDVLRLDQDPGEDERALEQGQDHAGEFLGGGRQPRRVMVDDRLQLAAKALAPVLHTRADHSKGMLIEELRLVTVGGVEAACERLRQLSGFLLEQANEDQDLMKRIATEPLGAIEGPLEMFRIDGGVALDERVGEIALALEVIAERCCRIRSCAASMIAARVLTRSPECFEAQRPTWRWIMTKMNSTQNTNRPRPVA